MVCPTEKECHAKKSTFPHDTPEISIYNPKETVSFGLQDIKALCLPHHIPRRAESKWKKRNSLDGK
jgi:hypothetical protein